VNLESSADRPPEESHESAAGPVPICVAFQQLLGLSDDEHPACCPPGRCQIRLRERRMGITRF
jgi:hypothetical protein